MPWSEPDPQKQDDDMLISHVFGGRPELLHTPAAISEIPPE